MKKWQKFLRNAGGWRGLITGLYFLLAFSILIGLLALAAANDIGDGLSYILAYWSDKHILLGGVAALLSILLLPGIIYGVTIELLDAVGRLTWRVLRKFGWQVNTAEFWSHDSWTWMHVVIARAEKPLTNTEASCWWLCRHKDGPDLNPSRTALALGISTREVRNAIARAERKLGAE
jgi:DNA-binding CsgD family transcriptional regulator